MISDSEYQELKEWVITYIDEQCIIRDTIMPGKLPGSTYTWMFYLRNGLFHHSFLSAIGQMFIYRVNREIGHFDFQLSGLETASTPMLAGIPMVARAFDIRLNSFSIRKSRKEYGLKNWLEGRPNNKPVMLIDDLCNSSKSMGFAHHILESHNIPVLDYAFCIVNKVNKEVHDVDRQVSDMYLPKKIKIISLFDLDDFGLNNPSH